MSVQDLPLAVALDCHPACDHLMREYLSFIFRSQGVTRGTLRRRRQFVGALIQNALQHQCSPAQLNDLHPSAIHDYVIAGAKGPRWAR
jgi:hypothetical protein